MESNAIKLTFVNRLNNNRNVITCFPNETFLTLKMKLCNEIDSDERKIQFFDERLINVRNNDFVPLDLQTVYYEIDQIRNNYVIVEIRNNYFGIPKWISINSNSTVAHLKEEISNFSQNGSHTFLFHEKDMLEDNRTIESYNIGNGSKIKVWRGPNLLVKLKFFYLKNSENIPTISTLQFSMTDSIKNVKNRISDEISPGKALNLALITDSSYWQNDKRLIDYSIRQEGTEVTVVDLQMKTPLTFKDEIKKGRYAKIFNAEDNYGSRIIVNRYKTNKEIVNKRKVLKYEIITHTLLNKLSTEKFVGLITMYEHDEYFFIATEYMDRGSLKTLYLESTLSENNVIDYSIQICEALDYMHSNKIMHRNITCSSVLVNSKNKIKLTNFHLSKYLFNATIEQLLEGIPGSKIETSKCWMSPEVLRNDPYGIKADIWSFSVTILEMFTHDRPYPNMNVLRATHKIATENIIHYDRNLIPQRLHDIIDRCLHSSQWERPSAKQCCQLLRAI